jgi:Tol biopolymer transport system component
MKRLSKWVLLLVPLCLVVLASSASGQSSSGRIVFETNHFCGSMDCGRGDIAVVNPDGSGLQVLTHERPAVRVSDYSPRWSPDRRQIAYLRPSYIRGQAGGDAQIWLMNADGTHQRQLTHLPKSGQIHFYSGDGTQLDWSPNGRQIVFAVGYTGDLYVVSVRTGVVTVLKRTGFFSVNWPTWSPDGLWIAFVESPKGHLGDRGQIVLFSPRTRHLRQVTDLPKNGGAPFYPAWSPDSRRIAFSYGGIHVINADGSHLRSLRTERIPGTEPSWSSDGNSIVFTEGNNLAVMKANGFSRHLITHVPINTWANNDPDW